MLKLLLLILISFIWIPLNAQQFGGNPPSVNWKAYKEGSSTIIFPENLDSNANRIANLIHRINLLSDSSIGKKRKPVSIVLQKESTISNGYVALAPFRSEFIMTRPVNPFQQGSLNWTDQLTLHEYRHIQQYSNFNRGIAKVFRIVLGEQGQALANALTVPDWFFEGDAVFQETVLSRQGRGRLPSFFNGYRSLWEEGVQYSYMKLRNGSLKNYVPDHYQLGYLLRAYGMEKYGAEFWKNVSQDAAAMKGLFYPFQKAVKRYSAGSFSAFTEKAFLDSRQKLSVKTPLRSVRNIQVLNEENPFYTEDGALLLLKSTYKKVPAFYIRQENADRKIRVKDQSVDNYFSYSNNRIVYASYRPDIRWGWRDYSELQILDIKTGKQKRVTVSSRYFTPSLSENADSIVTIQIRKSGEQALHLLNANGELINSLPNPGKYEYSHPIIRKGKIVVAAKNVAGEMALLELNPVNGEVDSLIRWSNHVVGFPAGRGDTIYFSMAIEGRDKIMAYIVPERQLLQWNPQNDSIQTGYYQPSVFQNKIAASQFTAAGYRIRFGSSSSGSWEPVSISDSELLTDFGMLPENNLLKTVSENPDDSLYTKHVYRKTTRLFNFHSWLPYYEDPEFSFSIIGQNILNTMQSQLFFLYNGNEGFKQFGYTGVFGAWFPYLSAGINYTIDRKGRFDNRTIYWNEMEANAGFQVPLNFSRGRSFTYLTAGSEFVYNQPYFKEPEKSQLGNQSYTYLSHELRFSHQVQQARQQIFPQWAQVVRLHYRHTLNLFNSKQLLATGNLYFPGIFANHSIVLNLSAQQRDSSNGIRFSNEMPFARGYQDENLYKSGKVGINYHFPICYPDAGLWNVVYLLRLRANFFYDYAAAKDPQVFNSPDVILFRSAGTELYFDTKWWNQLPVNFGIRYARLLDQDLFGGTGQNRWEFILPVNLVPVKVNSVFNPAFR
jgi:hypothetical protein